MLSAEEVSEKINIILDEIIRESTQRCKASRALRANYRSEELINYINGVKILKDSFNDQWWIPK